MSTTNGPSPRHPNILILMTDEHNPRYAGCYGHPFVRTPVIDGLAARGVRFSTAYCQSPLCVPSRMSNLTGKHVHKIRTWSNASILDAAEVTIPSFFADRGYVTVNTGKMHFVGPDQYHGFELRPFADVLGDTGRGGRAETPGARLESDTARRATARRSRLATAAGTSGAAPADAPPTGTTIEQRQHPLGPARVRGARPDNESPPNHFDQRVTEASVRFLREWQAGQHGDRPFLLWCSWLRPHFPFTPPQQYWDQYAPDAIDIPHLPPDNLLHCPPRLANWRRHWGVENLTAAEIRRARAAYYGLTTFVDDQIGTVLAELRALGLEEDTFIVYLSDHGEMAGEHGLWYKSVFFDGAAKVPFILSYPRQLPSGCTVDTPVELVDLFPTLAALVGAEDAQPPGLDGANLLPLSGATPIPGLVPSAQRSAATIPIKEAAFSEFYTQGVPSPQRMIRTARWKYNYYEGEPGELYDLQEDPDEHRNLVHDPGYRKVVQELEGRVLAGWNLAPVRAELDALMARNRAGNTGFSYAGPNRTPNVLYAPAG